MHEDSEEEDRIVSTKKEYEEVVEESIMNTVMRELLKE